MRRLLQMREGRVAVAQSQLAATINEGLLILGRDQSFEKSKSQAFACFCLRGGQFPPLADSVAQIA